MLRVLGIIFSLIIMTNIGKALSNSKWEEFKKDHHCSLALNGNKERLLDENAPAEYSCDDGTVLHKT